MKSMRGIIRLTLGAVAGGAVAAALLPVAVATADEFDFTPDVSTFAPSQVEGYPPLVNVVTGTETWYLHDLTTNANVDFIAHAVDTQTTFGSFTNDDVLLTTGGGVFVVGNDAFGPGTQFDLANFGGGFANEWVDVPGTGAGSGISDLLITPFGDLPLLGTFFPDIA